MSPAFWDVHLQASEATIFAHHYLRAEALSGVALHCLTVREERRGAMGEDRRAVNACIQSGGQGRSLRVVRAMWYEHDGAHEGRGMEGAAEVDSQWVGA